MKTAQVKKVVLGSVASVLLVSASYAAGATAVQMSSRAAAVPSLALSAALIATLPAAQADVARQGFLTGQLPVVRSVEEAQRLAKDKFNYTIEVPAFQKALDGYTLSGVDTSGSSNITQAFSLVGATQAKNKCSLTAMAKPVTDVTPDADFRVLRAEASENIANLSALSGIYGQQFVNVEGAKALAFTISGDAKPVVQGLNVLLSEAVNEAEELKVAAAADGVVTAEEQKQIADCAVAGAAYDLFSQKSGNPADAAAQTEELAGACGTQLGMNPATVGSCLARKS